MYEPVKFKRLKEIATELNRKLEQLHEGILSKDELENLTEESRELYERLVVLRFKAYQEEVNGTPVAKKEESTVPVVENTKTEETTDPVSEPVVPYISFRLDNHEKAENGTQVSLIDAIEEVAKEIKKEENILTETNVTAPVATSVQAVPSAKPSINEQMMQQTKESLHDKLAKAVEHKESLNNKMEHTSIPDLKRAISLNQRFQFSKELFKGNNQEYEVAIEKLNTTTREDAMKQLENLKTKYDWNATSAVAHDFMDLVERRYL